MGGGLKEPREQPGYLSYLRLWQVDTEGAGSQVGGAVWRTSLESSLTGERLGFASLDELFKFLAWQTGRMAGVEEMNSFEDTDGYA